MEDTKQMALVVGAGSGIAEQLIAKLQAEDYQVVAVGRSVESQYDSSLTLERFNCDYSETSIKHVVAQMSEMPYPCTRVFIANGILHNEEMMPEKKLEDFNPEHFQQVMAANTITPMLWLKHLVDVLKHPEPCIVSVLSARVGSITDNRLGGWYSYRTSKAALNMLIKTSAVEYARRCKNVKLLAFHPGTTDTPLSKPFQANVPPGKLFTPEFVASQLMQIVDLLEVDGQASFLDWQGKTVKW